MTRTFEDGNRRWIAENLLLDVPRETLRAHMVANGFAPGDVDRELDAAIASPYLHGSARLRNRLVKREWTLGVYRTLSRMRGGNDTIGRRSRLSRTEFFEEYYHQNRPVIITGMLEHWPALTKWSLDHFREAYGDRDIEVQMGRESDPDYEVNGPRHKKVMPLRAYVDMVEGAGRTNDFYMTANNGSHNRQALAGLWEDIPVVEEYLDPHSPETGFFWLGPAGIRTPFHHDLTNNFMAQVVGRKRVRLIPLHDTPFVYNHLHCYSMVDGGAIDHERFPGMRHAQVLECTLAPGELLFVPIGWWHYVEGLDVSAMMSFTNFRGFNDFAASYSTYNEL